MEYSIRTIECMVTFPFYINLIPSVSIPRLPRRQMSKHPSQEVQYGIVSCISYRIVVSYRIEPDGRDRTGLLDLSYYLNTRERSDEDSTILWHFYVESRVRPPTYSTVVQYIHK